MDARIWGPHAWFFLHSVTFSYPDNPTESDKKYFYNFFRSIADILPCSICKNHYKTNIKNFPIENFLDNRNSLVNWLIDIHNIVNEKLDNPKVNNQDIINKYNNLYKKKYFCLIGDKISSNYKNILLIILFIVNIIFIIIFYLQKKKIVPFNIHIKSYFY